MKRNSMLPSEEHLEQYILKLNMTALAWHVISTGRRGRIVPQSYWICNDSDDMI